MILAIDTETTGVDFFHGTMPFMATTCDGEGYERFWEFDVDPFSRQPTYPKKQVNDLYDYIMSADQIVMQNAGFDVKALRKIDKRFKKWPWHKTHETLMQTHLIDSSAEKNLTAIAYRLGVDIKPYEARLEKAVKEAIKYIRKYCARWRLADVGLPDMPSVKDAKWRADYWTPRALAQELEYQEPDEDCHHDWEWPLCRKCKGHIYWVVCREYALPDPAVTIGWHLQAVKEIERRGLMPLYLERLKLLPILSGMEHNGVTVSYKRLKQKRSEYQRGSDEAAKTMLHIAKKYKYDLQLPKGASPNNSIRTFVYDCLKMPPMLSAKKRVSKKGGAKVKSKSDKPSLEKNILESYLAFTAPESETAHPDAHLFFSVWADKRSQDTAITFLNAYERFGVKHKLYKDVIVLHPQLNAVATSTLRFGCVNPNEQNISKKPKFNLRYCFGPAPDREWIAGDFDNIELRIPAYESKEQAFINLFEKADQPPYFGSNHLLIAHLLFPKEFNECVNDKGQVDGRVFKDKHKDLYQRTKNGNFAVQYGAVDLPDGRGTADRTYGIVGAQKMIAKRFAKQDGLNVFYVGHAKKFGYVETMVDESLSWPKGAKKRGYPLVCSRTAWGVKETVPLNYHVQGTAMWCTIKAMIRCEALLQKWRREDPTWDGYMTLQVHDEIVFDLPRRADPFKDPKRSNLSKIRQLKAAMEQSGDDIGVPLTVSFKYIVDDYSGGEEIE